MPNQSFSQALATGRQLLGSWCTFASFSSAEVMTRMGFDFLILDMQHSEITQAQFPSILGAFREESPIPLVRAPFNGYHIINWLFDMGVGGVVVPLVNTPEEAKRAVDAAKYPPLGKRSFGPYRAAGYGTAVKSYQADADKKASIILQIETANAARNIERILEVPGIDGLFTGPNDIALSLLEEDPSAPLKAHDDPAIVELCEHVMRKAQAVGVPFGKACISRDEAQVWLEKGANFCNYGGDSAFLRGDRGFFAEAVRAISDVGQSPGLRRTPSSGLHFCE